MTDQTAKVDRSVYPDLVSCWADSPATEASIEVELQRADDETFVVAALPAAVVLLQPGMRDLLPEGTHHVALLNCRVEDKDERVATIIYPTPDGEDSATIRAESIVRQPRDP